MKKHVSSKKALLASIMSLVLCCAMLMGTTFAWFTDSVTSGVNRIQAGNLDVEMYFKNPATASATDGWQNVTNTLGDKFFVDAAGNAVNWEPGAVSVTQFKVLNLGNLALKYLFKMASREFNTLNGHSLKEVLKVAVLDGEQTLTRDQAIAATEGALQSFETFTDSASLNADASKAFTVVVYWEPTANDNNYNVKNGETTNDDQPLYINIDIQLNATQMTAESDSFNNQYDADAVVDGITVADFTATATASVAAGAVTAPVKLANSGATVAVTVPEGVTVSDSALNLTVKNVDPADAGIVITPGSGVAAAAYDIVIPEVTDANTTPITVSVYVGKDLTIDSVKHNDHDMDATPPAANSYTYDSATGFVTLYTKSFSVFAIEYSKNVASIGATVYTSFVEAFEALRANGGTLELLADVDMTGVTLAPINQNKTGFTVTFNGNGHTISNWVSNEHALFVNDASNQSVVIFNDINVKNCSVNTEGVGGITALFVAYAYHCNEVTITNCNATNCTVKNELVRDLSSFTAAFVAYAAGFEGSFSPTDPCYCDITVSDCTLTGGLLTGFGSVGGAVAHAGGNLNCAVTVNNLTVDGTVIKDTEDHNRSGAAVATAALAKTVINGGSFSLGEDSACYAEHPAYGRLRFNGVGTLTIDGVSITG